MSFPNGRQLAHIHLFVTACHLHPPSTKLLLPSMFCITTSHWFDLDVSESSTMAIPKLTTNFQSIPDQTAHSNSHWPTQIVINFTMPEMLISKLNGLELMKKKPAIVQMSHLRHPKGFLVKNCTAKFGTFAFHCWSMAKRVQLATFVQQVLELLKNESFTYLKSK